MNKAKLTALGAKPKALALYCADVAERCLRRFYAWAHRALSPPVSVYRKKDTLTIVDAPRIGGRLYLASVQPSATGGCTLSIDGATLHIAGTKLEYPDVSTASAAFRQVKKAMQPAGWGTWTLRLAGLLLAWLVFKAAFGALAGGAAQGGDPLAQDAVAGRMQGLAAAMADDPSFIPPDPAPQALPGAQPIGGALADRIYNESMAAAQEKMHEQMPPQPSASVEGLSGFGLEDGPDQSGPGCDPALAFQVDGQ